LQVCRTLPFAGPLAMASTTFLSPFAVVLLILSEAEEASASRLNQIRGFDLFASWVTCHKEARGVEA
jgi:hypothetical protein